MICFNSTKSHLRLWPSQAHITDWLRLNQGYNVSGFVLDYIFSYSPSSSGAPSTFIGMNIILEITLEVIPPLPNTYSIMTLKHTLL